MEPFIGMIILFAGNFTPRGWAPCDGQLLPISGNEALFSLLGTTYGGDGRTTFGLPDLRGRVPMHAGRGPGLTPRAAGQRFGQESVTLQANQVPLPAHVHELRGVGVPGDEDSPTNNFLAGAEFYAAQGTLTALNETSIAPNAAGSASSPVGTVPPALVTNFIIATQGIFPSRS